jgi:hypothetical protein
MMVLEDLRPAAASSAGYTMNDRLQKFMEALSLLAKQSDEPEAQLTMQARISEYFDGAVDRQAALERLRNACQSRGRTERARVLGWRGKVRRSNTVIASGWVWAYSRTLDLDQIPDFRGTQHCCGAPFLPSPHKGHLASSVNLEAALARRLWQPLSFSSLNAQRLLARQAKARRRFKCVY